MSTNTLTLDVWGFDMEVEFSYSPFVRGNYDEPDEPEYWEVEGVRVGGVEISPMLSPEQSDMIDRELIRKIHEEQKDARVDLAETYAADRINGYSNVFFAALNRMGGVR